MVAHVVVPFGDARLGVRSVRAVVREHKGADAGEIGLEGEDHHIAHQADVLVCTPAGMPRGWTMPADERCRLGGLELLTSRVSMSRTAVKYSSSLRASRPPRDALRRPASSLTKSRMDCLRRRRRPRLSPCFGDVAVAEEPLEHEARVGLLGDGLGRAFPGNVGGVGAGVATIAVAREAAAFAPDLQRGEAGLVADPHRRDLIDRRAVVDVRPGGLRRVGAGKPAGGGSGVVAGTVAKGEGVLLGEAGEHVEGRPDAFEGLEGGRAARPSSAPSAAGVHSAMFTPFGTKRKAMRMGAAGAEATSGPAKATPAPRRAAPSSRPCRAGRFFGRVA